MKPTTKAIITGCKQNALLNRVQIKRWLFLILLGTVSLIPYCYASYGDLVINEIMYNPSGNDTNNEWIEIYNRGASSIIIDSQWKLITGSAAHTLKLALGTSTLSPLSFALITQSTSTFLSKHPDFSGNLFDSSWDDLNNNRATISLRFATLTFGTVVYGTNGVGTADEGFSLERVNPEETIWRHSQVGSGTPGAANSSGSINTVSTTVLTLIPSSNVIYKGDEFDLDVRITDVTGLFGSEVHLSFDPNLLSVVWLTAGDFPSQGTITCKSFDNARGHIDYASIIFDANGSTTGCGILCSIRFKATGAGTAAIRFDSDKGANRETMLIDNQLQSIPISTQDSSLYLVEARTIGNISGICLIDRGTETKPQAGVIVSLIEIAATSITDHSGCFILSDVPCGTYSLVFTFSGTTPATQTDVTITRNQENEITDIGTITLIAGDANRDGSINILDWPYVVDAFGTQEGTQTYNIDCDLNQDKSINIKDVGIFIKNFGKSRPQSTARKESMSYKERSDKRMALRIEPNIVEGVRIGEIIKLTILMSGDIYSLGGEVHLSFDPDVLEMIDISRGNWPNGSPSFTFNQRFDNLKGRIDYAVGTLQPEAVGSATLAYIYFKTKRIETVTKVLFETDGKTNRKTTFVESNGKEFQIEADEVTINIPAGFDNVHQVVCYPNPAKAGGKVIFSNLPCHTKIRLKLMTIAGEMVYQTEENSGSAGRISCYLKKGISSGMYIFILEDGGSSKTGKLGIIR